VVLNMDKIKIFRNIMIICFLCFFGSQLLNRNNTSEEVEETKIWIIGWNDIDIENDIALATELSSIEFCSLYDCCAVSTDSINWIKVEQCNSYKEVQA